MRAKPGEVLPTPKSIAAYVKKYAPVTKMEMHGPMAIVREDDYQGHHIVVKTTYEMRVDSKPVTGHIDVSNSGQVAYHGLPNMSFDSAVDLVKKLIDEFPEDFKPGADRFGGGMGNMGGMRGMSGTKIAKATPVTPKSAAKPKKKTSGTRRSK